MTAAREAGKLSASQYEAVDGDFLAQLWARLGQTALVPDIQQRLAAARRAHIAVAELLKEHPHLKAPVMEIEPPHCIGGDGSQVYPQAHSPVRLGWVQAIMWKSGQGVVARRARDVSELLWLPGDDYEDQRQIVNLFRDLAEVEVARDALAQFPEDAVILDGGLLPWGTVIKNAPEVAEAAIGDYMTALTDCSGGLLASVISSPRSYSVVNLIRLAEAKTVDAYTPANGGPRDQDLFRYGLEVGERSAIFLIGDPRNQRFIEAGIGVCFFYLKLTEREMLRVELPSSLALDPSRVDLLHAAVLKESKALTYPISLAFAHHEVMVSSEVARAALERAEQEYLARGGRLWRPSPKQLMKG